jgi:hypothetical protein
VLGLTCLAGAASAGETITALASLKTADAVATFPVTIAIERFATDRERELLLSTVKSGGMAAAHAQLAANPDFGTLQVGAQRTPLKYAFVRTTDTGRVITAITGTPVAYLAAKGTSGSTREGISVGFVILEMAASGPGRGELVPAATISVGQNDVIVGENYNPADIVHLSEVATK